MLKAMRLRSMKSLAPKEESLVSIQEMHLLYNFDERCLFTAGDKKITWPRFSDATVPDVECKFKLL